MLVVILIDWLISEEFVCQSSLDLCDSEWRIRFFSRKRREMESFLPEYVALAPMCVSFFDHNFFSSKVYHDVEIFFSIYAKDDVEIFSHMCGNKIADTG